MIKENFTHHVLLYICLSINIGLNQFKQTTIFTSRETNIFHERRKNCIDKIVYTQTFFFCSFFPVVIDGNKRRHLSALAVRHNLWRKLKSQNSNSGWNFYELCCSSYSLMSACGTASCIMGSISSFFLSIRTTFLGKTSKVKVPPFHIVAETFKIWKTMCNQYERKIGTVSAMVATVKRPWSKMYTKGRFWSPNNPLSLHHMLFAFRAFLDSSLIENTSVINQ